MSTHGNTTVRTVVFITDHLVQIEHGLQARIEVLQRLIGDNPDSMDFRDQLDNARQALDIVREHM
jgi:hypothetical protein